MKYIIILILFSTLIIAQEYKIVEDEKTKETILVGISSVEVFQDSNFAWWYNSEYDSYIVDTNTVLDVADKICANNIKIVLGTWCSDSQREVPRFLKVLDLIKFPMNQLEIVGVDRSKKGIANEVNDLNIGFVPTIIIYSGGEEIGRIIESPDDSLEKDLVEIL